jgi:D-amino-acid dehydrogenase
MKHDVMVLGAGIVGVSIALHLQSAGRSVLLVDRDGLAYGFPRAFSDLIRYGLNRWSDVRYQLSFLPRIAPFLFSYWRNSSAAGIASATRDLLPLIEASVREHEFLFQRQPAAARLFSRAGWIKAYTEERGLKRRSLMPRDWPRTDFLGHFSIKPDWLGSSPLSPIWLAPYSGRIR